MAENVFLRNRRSKQFINNLVNIQNPEIPTLIFLPKFVSSVKMKKAHKEVA